MLGRFVEQTSAILREDRSTVRGATFSRLGEQAVVTAQCLRNRLRIVPGGRPRPVSPPEAPRADVAAIRVSGGFAAPSPPPADPRLRHRLRSYRTFLALVTFVDRHLEGRFALHLRDEHEALDESTVASFDGELAFNRRKESRDPVIVVPDPHFADEWGYQAIRSRIDRHAPPWGRRVRRAFWRGSSTGGRLSGGDRLEENERVRLCFRSTERPDLVDARIGRVVECDPEHERELRARGLVGSFVEPIEQLEHRYLISIDGWTGEWEGLWWKLYSGSVVLLVESAWEQWYEAWLEPWRHYVPVRSDLGNLFDAIEWCLDNDEECRAIAERARRLVGNRADLRSAVAYTREKLTGVTGVKGPA